MNICSYFIPLYGISSCDNASVLLQVLGVCRSMSKFGVPVRSMVVTGGHRQKTQMESLEQVVDILIATPGRFMYLIKEGFVHLSNLRW